MDFSIGEHDALAIFGSGTIAADCAVFLRKRISGDIYVYERKINPVSALERRLSSFCDMYYRTVGKDIAQEIEQVNPRMIFSINNTYIFPGRLAERYHILNYHNSLLPVHPGRNAEAWAIFGQDKVTGVTWHLVDEHVDTGSIVMQSELPLEADITSIKLLSRQTKLAFEMFQEIVGLLLEQQTLPCFPQVHRDNIKLHYSWEKPHDGKLDLSWSIDQMYAFLRAMDYGKLATLGVPTLDYEGKRFTWDRYSMKPLESEERVWLDLNLRTCEIVKNGFMIRLSGLSEVVEKGKT